MAAPVMPTIAAGRGLYARTLYESELRLSRAR